MRKFNTDDFDAVVGMVLGLMCSVGAGLLMFAAIGLAAK